MKNFTPLGLTLIFLFVMGCDTALYVGSRGMGIQSGEIISASGYTVVKYPYPMDKLWQVVNEVMTDMKASRLTQEKKIAYGRVSGIVHGEKVIIEIRYVEKDVTEVAILVGVGGNRIASIFIHEKIEGILKK
ncbi:MAG: DUF3568 domain-containing protein [Syntrophales bacterium]|nr:DUF3568 domain-containing protein [Syntrophales bacterium]